MRQALGPLNMYEITKESLATATTVLLDIYRLYFRDGVCAILYGLENFEDLVAPATYQEGVLGSLFMNVKYVFFDKFYVAGATYSCDFDRVIDESL